MAKTFGEFQIPVRARKIARQRKYSDCLVTQFGDGEVSVGLVAADRPKACGMKWEPDEVRIKRK